MERRSHKSLVSLLATGSLLLCLAGLEAPAQAGTLGSSGDIGEVDLMRQTVEVGEYLLEVSPTSIMLDASGRRIGLAELAQAAGQAGFTMTRVGDRYLLRTLQIYDPDLDGEDG